MHALSSASSAMSSAPTSSEPSRFHMADIRRKRPSERRAVAVGEPPASPDVMRKVRVAADLPAAERPKIEVMDERGAAFAALVDKVRRDKGADFSICDIEIPTRPIP